MAMDINAERAWLIKEIQQVEDISLLNALKAVLSYGLQSEGRVSLEQYNKEIDESEERIARGEFMVHEDAVRYIKGWRKKDS